MDAIRAYRERIGTAILILTISITWRSVANFTFRLLYSGQRDLVPTGHEIGWPHSRFGRFGAEKSIALVGVRISDLPVRSLITLQPTVLPLVLTEKYRGEVPRNMKIGKRRMYLT